MTAVIATGFAAVAVVLVLTPWAELSSAVSVGPALFLVVAAVVGELRPVRFVSAHSEARTLTTSAPFVLALIPVAGVGVALIAQLVASAVDDIRARRPLPKSLFNAAQYGISISSAAIVFSQLSSTAPLGIATPLSPGDVGALLLGGLVMIALNWILVAIIVSLSSGVPLRSILGGDTRVFIVTNLVLLSVGGIAADVAADGVWALTLLAAPVVAAHIFAATAARHAHDATHDSLTGLANRGQLYRDLERTLSAPSTRACGPALVLIDLDHFKDFNDTLGHPVGDTILRTVADRLVGAAPLGATVHRLGGDEFAVVVCADIDAAGGVARELLHSLEEPLHVESLELLVRASAGLAVAPEHGDDVETLMKNADIALYHAKLERDRISTYATEYDINTVERLQLLADLHAALDAGQLRVVYQPQFDLADRSVVAVEALLRWDHPDRGAVAPDDFVPLAENSGLIFPLTAYVLDAALAQEARWRQAGHDVRIAVNLSARHLSDLALSGQVSAALDRHAVPASSLVLEVTETGILSDPARADVVIKAVRALGVAIAIDDYGTGNASLSYLKRLEIDELKVDRSFVSNISSDDHDLIIVRSTIDLALALGLRVVAEGIEDAETEEALRALGRVIGQGHHLGHPVEAQEIDALLASERAPARLPTER
ncbi:putative bifunctional diguanylate cyclase/phosphodiesterase [Demequina activiva]|uniref:GGDEF-domain containing protein n=1 Tax=Demequina activiva TaxID=1582364 RepID=A0A919Q3V4_9MICO|nr:EAL domain-containing protein [Demequina activiva]GIG53390.1 GGDEF-domain containing protein [Demequina activiva]